MKNLLILIAVLTPTFAAGGEKALATLTNQVWLLVPRPHGIDDLQYKELLTRAEVQLRRAGIDCAGSGTLVEMQAANRGKVLNAENRAKAKEAVRGAFRMQEVHLLISLLKSERNTYVYSCDVKVPGAALIPAKEDVPGANAFSSKETERTGYAIIDDVTLYQTTGRFGLADDWNKVEEAGMRELDEFINAWLKTSQGIIRKK